MNTNDSTDDYSDLDEINEGILMKNDDSNRNTNEEW